MTCGALSEEQTMPNSIYLADNSSTYLKMTARDAAEFHFVLDFVQLFGVQLCKVQEGLIDTIFHFSLFETVHTKHFDLKEHKNNQIQLVWFCSVAALLKDHSQSANLCQKHKKSVFQRFI